MKMGKLRLWYWLKRWGFLTQPHAGLLGESPGIDRPVSKWSQVGPCEEAFGQGAAITGLQEITALAGIANGGFLMKPYIIKKIVNPYGKIIFEAKPKIIRRVISAKTDKEIKYMMRLVVKGGTGQYARLINYVVSGKTGTGQIVNPKTGKYYKNKYTASFMAFVPYRHPKLAMLVVQQDPRKISYYGGAVSAPVVREVFKRAVNILNIEPSRKLSKQTGVAIIDNAEKNSSKNLETNNSEKNNSKTMPDLKDDSIYRALNVLKKYKLAVKIYGSGYLYYQSIKVGSSLTDRKEVVLKFKPAHYN